MLKSLITWQFLGLGPSNLEGMLDLTVDDTEGKDHGQSHHDR